MIVGAIGICVLFSFATWLVILVLGFRYLRGIAPSLTLYNTMLASTLSGAAAADIIISVALAVQLAKRFQGFNERTDSMLWKLIRIALLSSSYTAVFATIAGPHACRLSRAMMGSLDHSRPVTCAARFSLPARTGSGTTVAQILVLD